MLKDFLPLQTLNGTVKKDTKTGLELNIHHKRANRNLKI